MRGQTREGPRYVVFASMLLLAFLFIMDASDPVDVSDRNTPADDSPEMGDIPRHAVLREEETRSSDADGPNVVLLRSSELRTGENASITFSIDDPSFYLISVRVVSNDEGNRTTQAEFGMMAGGNNWTADFRVDRYCRRVLLLIFVDNGYGTREELRLGWFDVRDVIPPTASMVSEVRGVRGEMNRFSFLVEDNIGVFSVSLTALVGHETRDIQLDNPGTGTYEATFYIGLFSPGITLHLLSLDAFGNTDSYDLDLYMEDVDVGELFMLGPLDPITGEWVTTHVDPVATEASLQSISISFDGEELFYTDEERIVLQVPDVAKTMSIAVTFRDRVDNAITYYIDHDVRDGIEPYVDLKDRAPVCGEVFEILPLVTDNVALSWYRIAASIDDGHPVELFGSKGTYCMDVPWNATRVNVIVWAADTAGNQAYSTFPLEVRDTLAPTVWDVQWVQRGKVLKVTANATDNRAVSSMTCVIIGNEGYWSFNMTLSDGVYEKEVLIPSSGPYRIEVWAKDPSGNEGADTTSWIYSMSEEEEGWKVVLIALSIIALLSLVGAIGAVVIWSRRKVVVDPSEIKKMREDVVPPERNALFHWGPDRYHHGERAPDWNFDPYFLYIRPGDVEKDPASDLRPLLPPWRRWVR